MDWVDEQWAGFDAAMEGRCTVAAQKVRETAMAIVRSLQTTSDRTMGMPVVRALIKVVSALEAYGLAQEGMDILSTRVDLIDCQVKLGLAIQQINLCRYEPYMGEAVRAAMLTNGHVWILLAKI